jgi:ABC-type branched-subunit amino acid transport system ATPase component
MNPKSYFEKTLAANEVELKRIRKLSLLLSMLRLAVFLAVALIVYFFLDNSVVIATSIGLGVAVFLFLVSKYTDAKNKKAYHIKLKFLNQHELAALSGDYSNFRSGKVYIDDQHHFNQDIDLFGEGSFFQRINRTGTLNGQRKLAQLLNANDTDNITEKQSTVRELAAIPDWRQHYQVVASLIDSEAKSRNVINWVKNYQPIIPINFKYIPALFALGSLLVLVLYGIGRIPGVGVGAWLFIGLGITGTYIKKITQLSNSASQAKDILSQYAKLIAAIEGQDFKSEQLVTLKKHLETEGILASDVLKRLSREINSLDQRNNLLFAFLANGFLLWDLRYARRVEKWIEEFDEAIENWFEVVEHFDALNSLGNMVFTHPEYVFPELSEDATILSAQQLGHPLIDPAKRVDNNIEVQEGNFFIITGANMAGKSTFLRTVALNLVMANSGLPVCAKSYVYKPIKLISSMRTTDSLQNDESYFFSELKRLKFIVDELQKDTYFIILDEILKGTNSKDKAEGSKKFVQRLVSSGSTGLIATHDLSLCTLADENKQVMNYYFDAEIINDELHFDYTFKDGICKNMNASFLLKKMEIV